jgi:hypothetical protein
MIPYIGCEHARDLIEGFIDGELAMADQVALESHLRWCRTCAARVEDLRLIGASMRQASRSLEPEDTRALVAIREGVLTRIRAEHEESLAVRVRAMFDDMRLFWPALGASAALVACLFASLSVMQAATAENPESLAAMIERLDRPAARVLPPANPGSDQNPMRLDGRVSFPRALDAVSALDTMWDEEVAITVSAVVTREGRIGAYDVVDAETESLRSSRSSSQDVNAVLDAVKRSRFAPAEAAGTKVAVNMVWLIVRTTARVAPVRADARPAVQPAPDVVKPVEVEETPAPPSTEAAPAVTTTA